MKIFIGIFLLLLIGAILGAWLGINIARIQIAELKNEIKELEKYKPIQVREKWKIVRTDATNGNLDLTWTPIYYFNKEDADKHCKELNSSEYSDLWKLGIYEVWQTYNDEYIFPSEVKVFNHTYKISK